MNKEVKTAYDAMKNVIEKVTEKGRKQSIALTKLDECLLWTNWSSEEKKE